MSAYILPPINAAAINAKTTRFGITDAMLVSSSVPETPAAAYAAGTTYALGAECSTGTAGGVINAGLVSEMKVGDVMVKLAGAAGGSSGGGAGSGTGLNATGYGRRYLELLRRNQAGPIVV